MAKLIQQKGRPIPVPLRPAVEKEIEKLKKRRAYQKSKKHRRNLFREPCSNRYENGQTRQYRL